jgi:hypothetical protein
VKRCWICGRQVTLDGPDGFVVHILTKHRDSLDGQDIMRAVASLHRPHGPASHHHFARTQGSGPRR